MSNSTSRYDPSAFRAVFERHFSYRAGFDRNIHRYADRPALAEPGSGRRWTYRELGVAVSRFGGGLWQLGLRPRDLIMAELFNTPEFAISYLGAQRLRLVFSPTNFRLAEGEIAFILDDSRPKALVYDTDRTETIVAALQLSSHQPEVMIAVGAGPAIEGSVPFDELGATSLTTDQIRSEQAELFADSSVYDETTRLYTSGTTGMPKPVPLPDLVEVLSAHDVIMHFPLGPSDKTLNMTPWFHRGGLYAGGPNPVFYVGAQAVTLKQFDPRTVLDLVQSEQLTYLIGAPTNLVQLADSQESSPRDLSSLKGVVTMGAPLDRAAALRYQHVLTPRIFNGYGTTETFWNTFLRPEDLPDGAGTAGRASTDDDVAVVRVYPDRLADPDDLVRQDGSEVGEVIMRSMKSGYSYLGAAELEATKFNRGWFYPGDLATWDSRELVTIVGRKDDMIISGGENVHPVQVEAALADHHGVADALVVSVPDSEWGQLVVAYVVRRPIGLDAEDAAAAAELDTFLAAHPRLSRYKRPRLYRFLDSLPYNATGKKVHYLARSQAQEDLAAGLLLRP